MKLSDLKSRFPWKAARGDLNVIVTGVSSDSRRVAPRDIFLCFTGEKHDGHDFALDALKKGAVGIVAQKKISFLPKDTPIFFADNVREIAGPLCSLIYGEPSRKLKVIGVTGTSGKTTTTYFLRSSLEQAGKRVELVGSLNPTPEFPFHTTPEAPALQKRLKEILDSGTEYAIVEVSSHAIHFGRVNGISFCGALLTNIYRDHLDLHQTEEEYAQAKLKWLKSVLEQGEVAVNLDFPKSKDSLEFLGKKARTYSLRERADISGRILNSDYKGSVVQASFPGGELNFQVSLPGEVNASNSLAAFTILFYLGVEPSLIAKGLSALKEVTGRYRLLVAPWGAKVLIDYAHTPVALERTLVFAQTLGKRVILVFGCVGSGDKGKRPVMGQIAGKLAHRIFVTTDDPREENPISTMEEIEVGLLSEGLKEGEQFFMVLDRREAIKKAVKSSEQGDIVVLAGRGHERYQRFKDELVYLDDEEEARRAMGDYG